MIIRQAALGTLLPLRVVSLTSEVGLLVSVFCHLIEALELLETPRYESALVSKINRAIGYRDRMFAQWKCVWNRKGAVRTAHQHPTGTEVLTEGKGTVLTRNTAVRPYKVYGILFLFAHFLFWHAIYSNSLSILCTIPLPLNVFGISHT